MTGDVASYLACMWNGFALLGMYLTLRWLLLTFEGRNR